MERHLLLVELPLNVLEVAGVVGDGLGQLGLDVGQPGTQAAHVLVQLLHGHQGFPQLLHPAGNKVDTPPWRLKIELDDSDESVSCVS